jgi:hypothetical protein
MTGYFYTSPKRENLFHRFHIGQEEQPIVTLAHLCDTFPENPNWIKWYSAIVLHSKYYQQPAAALDAPYDVLPAGIYRESEVRLIPQTEKWRPLRAADRDVYLDQLHQGMHLGGDYYLRRYPIWFNFRGNSSILLSETKALSVAARERGDLDADDLAQKQAQWIIGRNPFSSSIMYGEGYDWMPLYSVRSGQMVGALPVGIETKGNTDAPYWPTQDGWTYKEVWSQPAGEWIWLMRDLNGPAVVRGIAEGTGHQLIQFRDTRTGVVKTARAAAHDGRFRLLLPQGNYAVRQGATRASLTVISGQSYDLDMRREKAVDYTVKAEAAASGEILLRVNASGAGLHSFSIRADNLKLDQAPEQAMHLASGKTSEAIWHAHIISADTPWVAVVIADGKLANRKELTGTARLNPAAGN